VRFRDPPFDPGLFDLALADLGLADLGLFDLGLAAFFGLADLALADLGLAAFFGLADLGLAAFFGLADLGLADLALADLGLAAFFGLADLALADLGLAACFFSYSNIASTINRPLFGSPFFLSVPGTETGTIQNFTLEGFIVGSSCCNKAMKNFLSSCVTGLLDSRAAPLKVIIYVRSGPIALNISLNLVNRPEPRGSSS
jgi:hypothetical protein